MKLYYLPGACPLASQIALEWIGQPYTTQRMTREQIKQPEFLKLNPLGAVPVLIDGDFVLTQSSAILEYLADLHPDSGLLPSDIKQRAEVRRWLAFCNADVHRMFGPIFATAKFADTAEAQQEVSGKASAMLSAMFAVADKQLDGKQWIAGEKSIADPYLFTLIMWAKSKDVDIAGMQNLQRFYDRMASDPGVQAALKDQGLA